MPRKKLKKREAWVITADMGYGHQRAAYPFNKIAYQRIFSANNNKIIDENERKLWESSRKFYEWISRCTRIPLIGTWIFRQYDRLQRIAPLYPFRDLSKPNISALMTNYIINKGVCRSITEYISSKNIPLLTTFYLPAIAAEKTQHKKIYCIVTDSDINRVWVPIEPHKSKIIYLSPTYRVVKRLQSYGIPEKNIILTGFPLPKENIGGKDMPILKKDLASRLINLDPKMNYIRKHKARSSDIIFKGRKTHPLTLTYVIGGAGAQKEIGFSILESMKEKLLKNEITIHISIGIKLSILNEFNTYVEKLKLNSVLNKNLFLDSYTDKVTYFKEFSKLLRKTDILWTKPSELSFYTALGIPIICAPPIGAHEFYNRKWLQENGGGLLQEEPENCSEWIFDWIERGVFAKAAVSGYEMAENLGTYNIEKIIFKNK